ncbi:tRNA(His) guanylyltransferase Thg1 family protein [bacterium]|nr:tRNA(His) guanylyltransferase Thg1 family protein [bacterium]MBI9072926.1 tRNA(His) guanylyltransferase Thg1 family protein [Melioribacteraceae bacterium]
MDKTSLGDRMKMFEHATRTKLIRRMPVIIKLDGKAFHTFTQGMERPFDDILIKTMQQTALELSKNIQNCVLAYTQSDEISLLLVDYNKFETEAWFDNNIQKMASVAASMATLYFNKYLGYHVDSLEYNDESDIVTQEEKDKYHLYSKKLNKAMFDARVFNLTKEEVCNYFVWRQQDWERNSIQLLAQSKYSPKQMHGISCPKLQYKLFIDFGINWFELDTHLKRGTCVKDGELDVEIPTFKDDRNYIEEEIYLEF